jgi:hypothetical protein
MWCIALEEVKMKSTTADSSPKRVRTSVTVPIEDYRELESLARRKKVSVAWIVRDAVDQYLAGRRPPLAR